jgi:hypothetical protein
MTAINCYADPKGDAAYMITDAATYFLRGADAGIVKHFGDKAVVSPRLKVALAGCGESASIDLIGEQFRCFTSFDDVISGLPSRLRALAEDGEFTRDFESPDDSVNHWRIYLAGWSDERRRPEIYSVQSRRPSEGDGAKDEPFTMVGRQRILVQPGHHDLFAGLQAMGFVKGGQVIVEPYPVEFLTKLINWQRQNCLFKDVGQGHYAIGGQAVVTRIDAKGVTQTVVQRWNDRVGELIDPARDTENVTPLRAEGSTVVPAMSRVQLEIWERKQRKAGRR